GPRWRRGIAKAEAFEAFAAGIVLVDGVVGVADGRPQRPSVLRDFSQDLGLLEIGHGEEAAEFRFRIVDEDRPQDLTLVAHDDRAVVGEKLCKQRDDEQAQEDDEAPVASAVRLEVYPAARVDRGELITPGPTLSAR